MNRGILPSVTKQRTMCRKFFDVTSSIFKKHRLNNKPERIYTVSEIRVSAFLDATILVAAAADGTVLPPFVIFTGQRLKLTSARQVYPDAFFTCSYDGKVNDIVLLWWFRDHFLKRIPTAGHRPCALFLGRSINEVTFQLCQLAREERIHLISMPQGVAHLLQPLDDGLASDLESAIAKRAKKWEDENPGVPFTQKALAQILQKVWRKGINQDEIICKYAQNGIFPVNAQAITADRIAAASAALKESRKSPPPNISYKNSQFSGLSLLSALSSHEYASLEHVYGGNDNSKSSPEGTGKRAGDRVVVRVNKRMRTSEPEQEEQEEPEEEETEELNTSHVHHIEPDAMFVDMLEGQGDEEEVVTEEIVLEQLEPPDTMPSTSQDEKDEPPKVLRELAEAKANVDQINRAIESIGGNVSESEDGNLKPESGVETQENIIYEEVAQEVVEEHVEMESGETQLITEDGQVVTMDMNSDEPYEGTVQFVQEGQQIIQAVDYPQEQVITQTLDDQAGMTMVNDAELVHQLTEGYEEVQQVQTDTVHEEVVQEPQVIQTNSIIEGAEIPPELLQQIVNQINQQGQQVTVQQGATPAPKVRQIRIVRPKIVIQSPPTRRVQQVSAPPQPRVIRVVQPKQKQQTLSAQQIQELVRVSQVPQQILQQQEVIMDDGTDNVVEEVVME